MATCLKKSLPHCHDALNAASRYAQGPSTAPWRQNWESQWRWYAHPLAEGGCSSSAVEGGTWVPADFPFSYSFFFPFVTPAPIFHFCCPICYHISFCMTLWGGSLSFHYFEKKIKNRIMYFWKSAPWWLIYNKLLIQSMFFFIGDFTISLKVEHCFWQFFKNTIFFCSRVMPLKTGFSLKITLTNHFKLQENKVLIFHKYLEKKAKWK